MKLRDKLTLLLVISNNLSSRFKNILDSVAEPGRVVEVFRISREKPLAGCRQVHISGELNFPALVFSGSNRSTYQGRCASKWCCIRGLSSSICSRFSVQVMIVIGSGVAGC